jgi:Skp family chaperone for outer membrane proteins
MRFMSSKLFTATLLAVLVLGGARLVAMAEGIGVVNMDQVVGGYQKAQNLFADVKVREAEIRKMQADYARQLGLNRSASSKSPVNNNTLEQELNGKLNASVNEFKDWSTGQQKELDKNIDVAIRDVSKRRALGVVVTQQAVVLGGTDITSDVISELNSPATASPKK